MPIFVSILLFFGAPKWLMRLPRFIQISLNGKAKPLTKFQFIPRLCRTYLLLHSTKNCQKVHFCSILTPFWTPQVANVDSQAHPNWPKVKGQVTDIIPLHSHALQNLPLTTEKKKLQKSPFLINFSRIFGPSGGQLGPPKSSHMA